jgi:hypothetical protein
MNATKHGARSADAIGQRSELRALLRMLGDQRNAQRLSCRH